MVVEAPPASALTNHSHSIGNRQAPFIGKSCFSGALGERHTDKSTVAVLAHFAPTPAGLGLPSRDWRSDSHGLGRNGTTVTVSASLASGPMTVVSAGPSVSRLRLPVRTEGAMRSAAGTLDVLHSGALSAVMPLGGRASTKPSTS